MLCGVEFGESTIKSASSSVSESVSSIISIRHDERESRNDLIEEICIFNRYSKHSFTPVPYRSSSFLPRRSKFTVLGDGAIRQLLLSLSKEETRGFKRVIEDCLISISPGTESEYQPSPGIINRPDGQKILFRPFTSPDHVGTKIIVHPAPAPASEASESTTASRNQQALYGIVVLPDKYGLPTGVLNVEEITGYRTTMSAMIPYFWSEYTENIVNLRSWKTSALA